jgi:hypothetical protein
VRRRGWIVVFAKAPEPGRVKTRFTPPFSPEEAARFYEAMLDDVLDATHEAAAALGLAPLVTIEPPRAARGLRDRLPPGFRVIGQAPGDLGARMSHVLLQGMATGAPMVLLRGSDSPLLGPSEIEAATRALREVDVVVSPDADGGYGLVGVAARRVAAGSARRLFAHPMSTPAVLADTLSRARELALDADRLTPGFDLDRFDDLRRLAAARDTSAAKHCRRTLAFLDTHELWPPG